MLPDIKKFPVNWVDGMKISSRDFISMENAVTDEVRDAQATRLNEYNYGLLPTNHPEADNYPKLVYDYVNNLLILKECRALTPAGQRIEITEANHERKKFPAQLPTAQISVQDSGRFDVYLFVDTAERVGAGEFAQNNPPRYQAISPKYELSVRAQDGIYIQQENFLKISELMVREGRVEVLTNMGDYIPPCTTLSAFPALMRMHNNGEERLKGLIQHFENFIKKIGPESRNEGAREALLLAEKMVTPLISSLSHYHHIYPTQPPIFTVVYFKDWARFIRFHLDRNFQGEIINKYKPGLLELTAGLERIEPSHSNIKPSFNQIMQMLDALDKFFIELGDYDYNKQKWIVTDYTQNKLGNIPISKSKEEYKEELVEAPEPFVATTPEKTKRVF